MKETLEEDAEIFVNNRFTKQISGDKTYPDIYASKEAIIESHILFAKWQQERHNLLPGFINQFEEGGEYQELTNEDWSVSQFLKWLKSNNFKIIK